MTTQLPTKPHKSVTSSTKKLYFLEKSHLVQLVQRQTAFYCDQIVIYFEILEEFRSSLHWFNVFPMLLDEGRQVRQILPTIASAKHHNLWLHSIFLFILIYYLHRGKPCNNDVWCIMPNEPEDGIWKMIHLIEIYLLPFSGLLFIKQFRSSRDSSVGCLKLRVIILEFSPQEKKLFFFFSVRPTKPWNTVWRTFPSLLISIHSRKLSFPYIYASCCTY